MELGLPKKDLSRYLVTSGPSFFHQIKILCIIHLFSFNLTKFVMDYFFLLIKKSALIVNTKLYTARGKIHSLQTKYVTKKLMLILDFKFQLDIKGNNIVLLFLFTKGTTFTSIFVVS
jgi:hypothetical protein